MPEIGDTLPSPMPPKPLFEIFPLDPLAVCRGCGTTAIAIKYVAAGTMRRCPEEHISKLCRVCGYRWAEETASPEQVEYQRRKLGWRRSC